NRLAIWATGMSCANHSAACSHTASRSARPCSDRPPLSGYLIHPCVDHESIMIGEDAPNRPKDQRWHFMICSRLVEATVSEIGQERRQQSLLESGCSRSGHRSAELSIPRGVRLAHGDSSTITGRGLRCDVVGPTHSPRQGGGAGGQQRSHVCQPCLVE